MIEIQTFAVANCIGRHVKAYAYVFLYIAYVFLYIRPREIYTKSTEKAVSDRRVVYALATWRCHLALAVLLQRLWRIEATFRRVRTHISVPVLLNALSRCFLFYLKSHYGFSCHSPFRKPLSALRSRAPSQRCTSVCLSSEETLISL